LNYSKIIVGAALLTASSVALALPYNSGRPYSGNFNNGSGSEDSLQTILNENFNNDSGDIEINAFSDQSNVAAWTLADAAGSRVYTIDILTGATGKLGIYSLSSGLEYDFSLVGNLNNYDPNSSLSFTITSGGSLKVSDTKVLDGFGQQFGFYWENSGNTYYTEDDKNNGNVRALTYMIDSGTDWNIGDVPGDGSGGVTSGNDDWVIAFEDWNDNDYQDAVFFISDISAVPEPSILVLFGLGLAGMGFATRRRNKL